MPNYKYKNFYKTLLQIWLFYCFLSNTFCQINDVEFISHTQNYENDVGDVPNRMSDSDSDYNYEPIEPNHQFNFDNDIDEHKNVNLNINNNLHDIEILPQPGDDSSARFTEITEQEISGEKSLDLSESPYLLRQDLEVLQNGRLNIAPGVTIHFAPMVGITVYGQLKAIVSILNEFSYASLFWLSCFSACGLN
jgi:hypothetical protein